MRAHDLRDGTRSESAVASHLANSSNDGRRRRRAASAVNANPTKDFDRRSSTLADIAYLLGCLLTCPTDQRV